MSVSKIVAAAASGVGGAGLDVDEVFSTFLYDGTGSAQTITNNIDLSSEGGLVWIKRRDGSNSHNLEDTARGAGKSINSDTSNAEDNQSGSYGISAFNSNGFSLVGAGGRTNTNNAEYVSWTFRKAPKFFDVVTYTGTGGSRTLNHNLNSTIGMIIVKDYSNAGENWTVYHRGIDVNGDNAPETDGIYLNTTGAAGDESGFWNDTAPTSTQFTVGGNLNSTFGGGANYVAYLFAHNNSDGEFGPDSDQDIIKCGSYTGNGSTTGPVVNLGFEPQFLMIKNASTSSDWTILDTMRGLDYDVNYDPFIRPNLSNAEAAAFDCANPLATGFQLKATSVMFNTNNDTFIYMAIRRGSLFTPTDATKVFAMDTSHSDGNNTVTGDKYTAGFPIDFAWQRRVANSGNFVVGTRLLGKTFLTTDTHDVEGANNDGTLDHQTGWYSGGTTISTNTQSWMWKRAPGYLDVVAWTGNDTAGRTVAHNLGVAPEMIWVKNRSATVEWAVYHKDIGTSFLKLNEPDAKVSAYVFGADSSTPAQSSTNIILSSSNAVNELNKNYIGYLFATVAGVSKVGSYTGNDTGQNIECGFSSGARFVVIKCSSHGDRSWMVFDSTRGIVAGADPFLTLNSNSAQNYAYNGAGSELNYTSSNLDLIDPYSSGFAVVGGTGMVNENGKTYIFYAIA